MKHPYREGQPGTVDGLARRLAKARRITVKEARETLRTVLTLVDAETRSTGRIKLPGFGTFKLAHRKPRKVTAPNGETYEAPAREVVTFRAWRVG